MTGSAEAGTRPRQVAGQKRWGTGRPPSRKQPGSRGGGAGGAGLVQGIGSLARRFRAALRLLEVKYFLGAARRLAAGGDLVAADNEVSAAVGAWREAQALLGRRTDPLRRSAAAVERTVSALDAAALGAGATGIRARRASLVCAAEAGRST